MPILPISRRFDPADPELMDRPRPVTPALERDLANLRRLNHWFGARRVNERILGPCLRRGPGRPVCVVDFAAGSGDLPREMARLARRHGTPVEIHCVEAHPSTLEIGKRHCRDTPEITWHLADMRTWEPPPDARPDWVTCSQALHHFTEEDATLILRRMRAITRGGALLADLERSPYAVAGIFALSPFFLEPMTREDMRRSALAAFTKEELQRMARAAGWPETARHERFFYGRQALWFESAE